MNGAMTHTTRSICPICKKQIEAEYVQRGQDTFFEQHCAEHGTFTMLLWRGKTDFSVWCGREDELPLHADCPSQCGICQQHLNATCCILYEITGRCNLTCAFCFAEGTSAGEPGLEQIAEDFRNIAAKGEIILQLSGGEPTLREDLPEIIAAARSAGIAYVQLNTNGIRLAEERGYAERLYEAGLSFVFLQFDGTDDAVYHKLRGRPLMEKKAQAIQNCGGAGLGVVLVPTLVPGVNDGQIGNILRYAIGLTPIVRGVHFQPVTYMGRTPRIPAYDGHITLDTLLEAIETQSNGLVRMKDLKPSSCDHPLCGLHGDFIADGAGQLVPLNKSDGCGCKNACAEDNRRFVARRWKRDAAAEQAPMQDGQTLGGFLQQIRKHGFTITAMAFQDSYTLDLRRLRRCSLHVYQQGRMIPFCAYYQGLWK